MHIDIYRRRIYIVFFHPVIASHIDGNWDAQGRHRSRPFTGEWNNMTITQYNSGGTVIYLHSDNHRLFFSLPVYI